MRAQTTSERQRHVPTTVSAVNYTAPLKSAFHTVVDSVGRWVDDIPENGASSQLQIALATKHSAEFHVIKLLAP